MPEYTFFTDGTDIRIAIRDSVYAGKLSSEAGLKKIDFETEAPEERLAKEHLRAYLEKNMDTLKKFTGDTGFSAVMESLLR